MTLNILASSSWPDSSPSNFFLDFLQELSCVWVCIPLIFIADRYCFTVNCCFIYSYFDTLPLYSGTACPRQSRIYFCEHFYHIPFRHFITCIGPIYLQQNPFHLDIVSLVERQSKYTMVQIRLLLQAFWLLRGVGYKIQIQVFHRFCRWNKCNTLSIQFLRGRKAVFYWQLQLFILTLHFVNIYHLLCKLRFVKAIKVSLNLQLFTLESRVLTTVTVLWVEIMLEGQNK